MPAFAGHTTERRTSQLIRLPSSSLRHKPQRPVYEGIRLAACCPLQHLGSPCLVACQMLVLASQPSDQKQVHASPHWLERRSIKVAIVLLPSPQDRIENGREISQALVALQLQVPSPDRLPHDLEGVTADRRGEVHINPAILVHRLAGTECIAEKCELGVGVIAGPIDVLAIHNARLTRMQFELAGLEPLLDAFK